MNEDTCEAMCWMEEWSDDAVCSLPPGHDGAHWDKDAGWEW
jgi:hypothetical protein